jgi:transposase
VAQEFGVNLWNLRDWKRQYGAVARPVDGPIPLTPEAMAQEIQQLRKELARVTMQRDILKKSMGILSET